MKIKYATISKTGRRSNNEDCFNILEMPEHNRFMGIVCDGMGGHSFTKPKIMCASISDGKLCHAVSSPIAQKSLFPTSGSSPFRKETGYYFVLMACTRVWHPTSCKQGCWTTSPRKIYSMYLIFSVKNKVMTTIRLY